MAILGLRGTGNLAPNEMPHSWREGIIHWFPNGETPLVALTSQGKSEDVSDYQFNWWEKGLPTRRIFINAAAGVTAAATTAIVDDGAGGVGYTNVKAGSVLMNERTFEQMIVGVDPTTATLQIDRGKGSIVAAAMVDNDPLQIVGSAYEDGATARVGAVAYDPLQKTNVCQIFDDSMNLSRRVMKTRLRTGDKFQETRRETLQIHMIGLEWALLFGDYLDEQGTIAAVRRTKTGGLYYWVTTNIHDGGGVVSYFDLMDWLEDDFRYGAQEKLLLAGSTAINALNKLAKMEMTMNTVPGEMSFGMNIKEILTPFGVLYLKNHPLLSDHPTFRKWGFILDMEGFILRTFDDTLLITDVQENNVKRKEDEYYSDIGLELQVEKKFAIWKNIASAA
jgi:hypothetical protein